MEIIYSKAGLLVYTNILSLQSFIIQTPLFQNTLEDYISNVVIDNPKYVVVIKRKKAITKMQNGLQTCLN